MAGAKVAGEVGSFGYNKGVIRVGSAAENYAAHVQVSRREAEGYYFQSDYQTDYANGKLQYYLDDVSDITFGFEVSDRAKDSHGSVSGVTQAEVDPQSLEGRDYARMFDVALNKMYMTYARDVDARSNLMVNLYQFTDQTNFVSRPQDYDASGTAVADVDAYINGNDYDQVQQGLKSEWRTGGEQLAWMAGIDLRDNSYDNYTKYITDFKTSPFSPTVYTAGTVTGDNSTEEAVRAVYGELKLRPVTDWTFTLNGRYDDIALDYSDKLNDLELDKSFTVMSWRAGANHALSERTDLYANASTGFRTPTVNQLFAGDISPFGDTESNPDLKPEQSLNLELGLRGKGTIGRMPVDYDVAVFQLDRKDYIMATTGHYSAPETGTERYENIGGTRSRGLELALNTDPTRTFSADVAYTYLDAVYTDYEQYNLVYGSAWSPTGFDTFYDLSGNRVPRVPRHHLNLTLNTRVNPELLLSFETDTISDYYADDLNRLKIAGHTVVNFLANYNTRLQGGSTLELFARIDNVLDRYYFNTARTTGDRNEDGIFDEEDMSIVVNQGRTFTVGMSMLF
jgi:iron complex outermembrane receptor protein